MKLTRSAGVDRGALLGVAGWAGSAPGPARGADTEANGKPKAPAVVSEAQYKAVLSFIPLPSRVALTGSIAELRRVRYVVLFSNTFPYEDYSDSRP